MEYGQAETAEVSDSDDVGVTSRGIDHTNFNLNLDRSVVPENAAC